MRTLFLDCFSGISGDMAVGALCDLGITKDALEAALAPLRIGDEFHLHISRQARGGIDAAKFDVHIHDHSHHPAHEHSHSHHHHEHGRSFTAIREMIEGSSLSAFVKERAVAVFRRIAVAEGKVHGLPPDEVHFHEVGAVDSIVDIVAFCAGLEALGNPRVLCSPLVEGSGFIDCAHGRFPLPAPATLEILAGIPLRQIGDPGERITPTGAALVAEFAESFGPMPGISIERVGYGAGSRNPEGHPNVLRAVLGTTGSKGERDAVVEIVSNIDDLSPELLSAAAARLLSTGALDVSVTPIVMKKGRPAFQLTVLTEPSRAEEFARAILRETSAFGVRLHTCERLKLRREVVAVDTSHGPVEIKRGWLGGELVQASPEFESCRAVAERAGVSVRDVYLEAQSAAARLVR